MDTVKVSLNDEIKNCSFLIKRVRIRLLSAEEFIETHASGTLRKNKRLGMVWRQQYLQERTAYEFGYGFECLPRSRIAFGDALTEGDCHSITEAGWFAERHIEMNIFPEDRYEVKHISVDPNDLANRRGVGLILRETSAQFIPDGHIVFSIIAQENSSGTDYLEAKNPS